MTYSNPVAAAARIIPHNYMDASDAPGQYAADQKGLQAVTAAFLAQPDFYVDTFFMFRKSDIEAPGAWVLCESVDPKVDGSAVDIWTYSGAYLGDLSPETEVYVSKKALVEQGFTVPENANPAFQHLQKFLRGETA